MSPRAAKVAGGVLAGIGLAVFSTLCFAALDTTTKYVSSSVSLLFALWVRYSFQAVATTLVVLPLRGFGGLRTAHPRFQLLRGVLMLLSSLFAFLSLRYMPVGEFTAIIMITPLVITLLASTLFGERVSPLRWMLVAGGFVGTLVIVRPGAATFHWATLLPLALVASSAWFQLLTSKLARTEDPLAMHFYSGWIGTLLASLALPFVWTSGIPVFMWSLMLWMGLLGTVGHFILILAFQRAPAAALTPYLYGQIGFAMLGGWIVFSHVPDVMSLTGMLTIAVCGAGGAWLAFHESRAARLAAVQPLET